ncbi:MULTISPECIES: DUF881 domain-containing protein [Micromonospora]|uniref:DUF881 domain-containing protein n=1 Tax=Micromonospora solifontis TaxID=2487138 RepID=A0ABX9WKH6_9ACTN|nr:MULTISPECIES: DUF881 domain-containing protein [Micromonospora]NES13709.1 DUF881 domain-containing protein [Micromonospora sp. PPF5-17B]NES35518.1 DUF881 domain-containing protein [Micromonospora solifontis]NES55325.1 DUF881 domain-containing protein [Micromonospora sp. PPF5-6]RNM00765.1 DUF881 domain-containing protein [Micromonospora solifontis]
MSAPNRDGGDPSARVYAPDFLTELFRNPLDPGYADAAARRRTVRPSRVRQLLGRPVSLVVIVVIGFLFAVAYRETMAEEPGRAKARAGLVAEIKQREAETDRLTARADQLREEVSRQRDAALGGSQASRLRNLEAGTGLGRVRGDGVVVRLADAAGDKDAVTGADAGPSRVLYSDLQKVANALWAAGAEAIAINGQRLTATSTIRSAGEAILVDYRPVTGPYEVSAIGPGSMRDRFDESSAADLMRTVSRRNGLSFGVKDADNLTLPAAPQPRLRYAEPSVSPSPSPSGSGAVGSTSPGPSGSGTSSSPSGGGR